ncbi:hypothetical protein KW807_01005 [Candidatus Parcubacteria bacterium]|nr:hypothetical protein [Candidatus Parcubacteria bacterium]
MPELVNLFLTALVSPLVVGLVLWFVGSNGEKNRVKAEAIRDLMTYRGDLASPDFRRSLNKVSIIFHDDEEIRKEVRHLYQVINTPSNTSEQTKRAIVGLIYILCQKNRFNGLTEYDIDQAFPENKQAPDESTDTPATPVIVAPVAPVPPLVSHSL